MLVESWGHQLLAPERSVRLLSRFPDISNIGILDCTLIEPCCVESPNLLFVEAVIDNWLIAIRRISVNTFSLVIIEVELLIIVFSRNNGSVSNGSTFLGIELL